MPETVETTREWLKRHGNVLVQWKRGVWLLATGATIVNHGLGPRYHEPPLDDLQRLTLMREYQEHKLKRAETAFKRLKTCLLAGPGDTDEHGAPLVYKWDDREFGPCPQHTHDGRLALLRLRDIVHEHRHAIADIDAQLKAIPRVGPDYNEARAQRKADRESIREARAEREAIKQIDLT